MRKVIKLIFISFLIQLAGLVHASEWIQVPIRSIQQKNAGLQGGEGMQMVQSIAYAPSNPDVVYMVSDTSQVWKSIDGGTTWKMKHNGFYANGGLSVVVDPLDEHTAFVAGSIGYPVKRYRPTNPLCGIFRTTDGGNNWKLVKKTSYFKRENGDNGGKYFAFACGEQDGKSKTIIYAGTYKDGLLRSTDGGNTWTCCGFKGNNIFDIRVNPQNQSIVFLATTQGFYRYADQTHTINKIGEGLPDYPRTIDIHPENPNIIYAAAGKSGVYWSTDGGLKFSKRDKGLPRGREYTHISLSKANPEYLYVSMNNSNILNPFRSHDGGATWHAPNTLNQGGLSLTGEQRFFSGAIEPHPKNPDIALTSANGKARVLMTTDGGKNWFYSGNGYTGGRMGGGRSSIGFYDDPQKMLFFLIDHGPVITADGGKIFEILDVSVTGATTTPAGAVLSNSDTNIIVTAIGTWHKQTIAVSHDGGKRWNIFSGTEDNYKFISFHPQNPDTIYAQKFISKNAGKSWIKRAQKVHALFRGNGDMVYSVDSAGKSKSVIKRSDNQGEIWTILYPELPINAKAINEIDIDPTNPDCLYAATNTGFYIYDGKKWSSRGEESGLEKDYFGMLSFKCVAIDPRHPEIVYTGRWAPGKGQSEGIFRSVDYGKTWENITYNLGLPINIWSVSVSPHDGTVFIGSSHGTWKLSPPY